MRWLLDTCVISELVKPDPHPGVAAWVTVCPEEQLFLCALSIGELQKGVAKLSSTAKKRELQRWVDVDLQMRFSGRIIAVDTEVAQKWGRIQAEAERTGQPMPVMDGLIAACALTHNLTVVTRNTKDMAASGVDLYNPWDNQP